MKDLKVIFDTMDVSKSGTVSLMEAHAAICSDGKNTSHLQNFTAAMFQAVDSNHNGKVSFSSSFSSSSSSSLFALLLKQDAAFTP